MNAGKEYFPTNSFKFSSDFGTYRDPIESIFSDLERRKWIIIEHYLNYRAHDHINKCN